MSIKTVNTPSVAPSPQNEVPPAENKAPPVVTSAKDRSKIRENRFTNSGFRGTFSESPENKEGTNPNQEPSSVAKGSMEFGLKPLKEIDKT